MALIKRKQIDLYIKPAPGGTWGLSNLSAVASGAYALVDGEQVETSLDKIVGAIDTIQSSIGNAYYTYTVNGSSTKTVTLGGSVDVSGTTNQITVAKTDSTNGVSYAISLPNTLIVPGSLKVTTTTELVGNITLSSTSSQTITHTGTGDLTIASTNGSVKIEGTTFNGNDVTIAGNLNVVGDITQTQVNNIVVADALIKLANGNNGSINVTGTYQQTGSSSYAGLVYSASDNQFKLFTTSTEPTSSTSLSALTAATLDFGAFGSNATEALQDAVNAFISVGTGLTKTYTDSSNTLQFDIDLANLAVGATTTATLSYNSGNNQLEVDVKGLIEVDAAFGAGQDQFTVNATGDATVVLQYAIVGGAYFDSVYANREFVEVYVNGVKVAADNFDFSGNQLTVYSGSGSVPPGGSGLGYELDSGDIISVVYYGS